MTKTSQAILEAGFRVLSRNPGANIAEIAEAAGTTRATLHRYFPSRLRLVEALAHQAIAEMDEAVAGACAESISAGDALRDAFAALVPLGDRHGFLAHEALEHSDQIGAEFARVQRETCEWIDAAKQEGALDATIPTEWINRTYEYLLYAAWDSIRYEEATPKHAVTLGWQAFVRGVGASDDGR